MQTLTIQSTNFKVGIIPYIIFPPKNQIEYGQDFCQRTGIPSGIKFYPLYMVSDTIFFMGDNFGILKNNRHGIPGHYGNGQIAIDKNELPTDIRNWCINNLMGEQ